jgi:tRNA A-37 threonylcarbamoyl transferase component Bud32
MTPERWQQIERLFHAAREVPATERAAYIGEQCAGDDALRGEVESLLGNDEPKRFLERPAIKVVAEQFVSAIMPDLTGQKLGPYDVISRLGKGGMGEVYKARDTRLKRDVAIKVVREGMSDRFQREARAIAALNHPHICTLYDVGPDYLVMEYIEGEPLRYPMNLRNALLYAGQILEALEAAHRHGIVHRDLKPSNIMLTSSWVKLLDFGLAKRRETGNEEVTAKMVITAEHTVVGTPSYMAPEQIEGGPLDHRTDIFAFGCVLYEMIAGKLAFKGGSPHSVMQAVLDCDNRDFQELQAPEAVKAIVSGCLRRDPDARWQTAHDIRMALSSLGTSEAAPSGRAWGRVVPWIAAALFATAAMLWFALRPRVAPPEEMRVLTVVAPEGTKSIQTARISPDGRFLAIVADNRLWIRPLNSPVARPVEESFEAHRLFWAPDSSAVGFFAEGKLKRVAAAGGVPETLAPAPDGWSGAWSGAGFIIYAPSNSGLYQVPANGGPATQLTALVSNQISHDQPILLPNGRLMYEAVGSPEGAGVWVADLPAHGLVTGAERLLKNCYLVGCAPSNERGTCTLLFLRDHLYAQPFDFERTRLRASPTDVRMPGESMPASVNEELRYHFNVSNNGIAVIAHHSWDEDSAIVALDSTGRTKSVIAPPAQQSTFALSPDGTELAITRRGESWDLWVQNIKGGTVGRLTSNPPNGGPVWSPDGSRLAFGSWRDGHSNLYVKEAHGSAPETRLPAVGADKSLTDWSHDGRYLMYQTSSAETGLDLWFTRVDSGANAAASEAYLRTGWNEYGGRFSPDGQWVAYSSDESGQNEVYVQSFPAGRAKRQISTAGGVNPVWRADGREIYYLSPDGYMMGASVTPGPAASAGEPKRLFPDLGFGRQFAVDAAGATFYVNSPVSSRRDLVTVVLNWRPDAN